MADCKYKEEMRSRSLLFGLILILTATGVSAQSGPISPARPFVVKNKKQVADITKEIAAQDGNKNQDIVGASGSQMRVAIFHDDLRENDNFEVHDGSDDIYYILDGKATLMLGGTLISPSEISPGEWRSKAADGGQKIEIGKGDLIVVPRGTVHQRTVTGKGFSMILIKVFEARQQ